MTPKKGGGSREPDLTLQEAADLLGVHYMTAYRYVRTGRLPGTRVGAHWHVRHADLDKITAAAPAGRNAATRRAPKKDYVRRLTSLLVQGDEAEAWRLLQAALASAYSPEDLYLDVLGPAMRRVGDDWATGRLDVADEHRATVVMYRLVGRLGPLFARRGTTRGAIVLGAPVRRPPRSRHRARRRSATRPRLFDHRSRRQHARRLVGEHHRRHATHRRQSASSSRHLSTTHSSPQPSPRSRPITMGPSHLAASRSGTRPMRSRSAATLGRRQRARQSTTSTPQPDVTDRDRVPADKVKETMSESAVYVSEVIRFPHLAARDLEGRSLELPDAFSGASNLVIVAFRREQQAMVDSWIAWWETIAAEHREPAVL